MEIFKEPWSHIVIDDYYPTEVFDRLLEYSKKKLKDNGFGSDGRFRMRFERDPDLDEILKDNLISNEFFKYFTDHREYNEDCNVYTELSGIIGPYRYKLHSEAPNKLMSLVVYLGPEDNRGTRLFDKDKKFVKEIEWKPNRAMLFCGEDDVTWHDYLCDKGKFRMTINQFIERGDSE
tara:strand:- start:1630 stop:2160 length:531 start_codon:yes stop_codon:yes gene_type:complete